MLVLFFCRQDWSRRWDVNRANEFATQPPQMSEGSQPFRERAAMSLRLDWVAQLVQTAPLQKLLGEPGEPVES